jgi:NodT family efflux transporter outer membrane factor (OMF) lipoprotein
VAAELTLAVIELRGLQRRQALAQDTVVTRERTLALVRWRHEAGLNDGLALQQAQTAWAQAVAQIPPLQASIAQTRHALAVLCGWSPGALDARLGPDWADPRDVPVWPDAIVREAPARVLEQRADVAQARSAWEARRARLGAAQAARWPSLTLSGSLALQALSPSGLAGGTVARVLGASLSGPLLDGGAAQAEVSAQEALLDAAATSWRATVVAALAEVEDRTVALARRRDLVSALGSAADSASAAAALANRRHESGLIDLATVLDTERTRLSALDSLAVAQAQLAADHVSLIKALGGPWTSTAH